MSVDDWARREAEREYGLSNNLGVVNMRDAHTDGIVHAFSALLSDEAVEAASRKLWGDAYWVEYVRDVRAALQAAVRAVTEGEGK